MNTRSQRAAHKPWGASILQKGACIWLVTLALSLWSCGNTAGDNPVGGTANNPLADFAGKTYKGEWETFSISKENDHIILKIGSGTDDTIGKVVASSQAEQGTVYLLECSQHKNWGAYQYPIYSSSTTQEPHSGCYLPVHIRSISANSVEWATFYTKVEGKDTTCFAINSKEKAAEYLDFSKWDAPYAYSTGTVQ